MSVPVPQPPAWPLIGNLRDVDPSNPFESILQMAQKYGPIYKLNMFGQERYFVSTVELMDEICDEKRFQKTLSAALKELRHGVGDGLFTAYNGEHNWEVAHRALVPAFGPLNIRDMYDEMYDIATQLVAKWARMGEDEPINVTDDYTRLTLDSIALCAMDKRFNSFYHEEMHPFVDAMVETLTEAGLRTRRSRLEQLWNTKPEHDFRQNIALMRSIAQEVVDKRRSNPSDKKDLLNAMLFGKDPKTGERLTDESIMNNMITFLIAGHETTSGMLSFASYFLMKNPSVMRKAQEEVDRVAGTGPIKFEHMAKLPYLEAVLRETLRLRPTAPAIALEARETSMPTVLGGKYQLPPNVPIIALLPAIGRDPAVFGADADEFRPERMYGENFKKLPPNAWKPFGNGARGCIGRPFAWQEGILALALILQNFNLRLHDPSYTLRIKQTLTVKPDGLEMRVALRPGIDPVRLERKMFAGIDEHVDKRSKPATAVAGGTRKPLTVLYGSNSGTCEGLSQVLAGAAAAHGFTASVHTMDAGVNKWSVDEPLVVITSSYEGQPPDNAVNFVDWVKSGQETLTGLKYGVFGCGHSDWFSTFHKIPNDVNNGLEKRGATSLCAQGGSDVSKGTVFDDFDAWLDNELWPKLGGEASQTSEGIELEISTSSRASHLKHNVQDGLVLSNEVVTATGTPEKRHIEIKLPTGLTYEAGDYLAILPVNDQRAVSRVLRKFNLPWDAVMTLKKGSHTSIPEEKELSISSVLASYVELNVAATKKNIATIAAFAPDQPTKDLMLASTATATSQTPSVLDILEEHPSIHLPFGIFLGMLTAMRIRQYSISSSPLHDPTKVSVTFSVVGENTDHVGVATNYLKALQPGSTTQVMVKKSHTAFHLPLDDETPVIMLCAGTGLAPFKGFVQERVAKLEAAPNTPLGEAILVVGCRDPNLDKLFAAEFEAAEKLGAVKVLYAFSRAAEQSFGCKYVQDRMWRERADMVRLFDAGARVYICGSAALGKGISDTVAKIMVEERQRRKGKTMTQEAALQWWSSLRNERYAVDVFD